MEAIPTGPAWHDIEALYRGHAPAARRFAYLLTGDVQRADDLTQDAFLRVAGRLQAIRRPEAFRAYLYRTIRRLAAAQERSSGRARRREERVHAQRPPVVPDGTAPVDPALLAALARLPIRARTALVLRAWGDCSDGDIARVLGCRPATVRSLIARARHALQEDLDDHLAV